MATVRTGARLHFGFQNLSLAHDRLYGGVGVALESPGIELTAHRSGSIDCADDAVEPALRGAVDYLDVPGARLEVHERYERHVGLGSGTQLALSCLVAVARAYGRTVDPRTAAPSLGRGGRSGVGVATFERGGFVVDGGHPTERFTTAPPDPGTWTVPAVIARHELPADWRFVLCTPEAPAGKRGAEERASLRTVVERADPSIGDRIAALLTRRLLPAVATADREAFGSAVAQLGRLNGAWYADEQGGVFRPPAGRVVERMGDHDDVAGAGQSSWGPTVYAVTAAEAVDDVETHARDAFDDLGLEGRVRTAKPRDSGASIRE